MGFILKPLLGKDILVPQNASIFVINFPMGLIYKKARIFMNSLEFMVLHYNTFYRYIVCVTCFSVRYTVLLSICLFCDFYILMKSL